MLVFVFFGQIYVSVCVFWTSTVFLDHFVLVDCVYAINDKCFLDHFVFLLYVCFIGLC